MSEITETHTARVPPPFPPQGRLPGRALQVGQNCHQQNSDERRYHRELCGCRTSRGAAVLQDAAHQPVFRRYRQ